MACEFFEGCKFFIDFQKVRLNRFQVTSQAIWPTPGARNSLSQEF